jgi:hypothetical protein
MPAAAGPSIVLLYAAEHRDLAPDLAGDRVPAFALEGFHNAGMTADTVVLGGHSLPPIYVGQPPKLVARAIASFRPSVVVLETCYGASTPLLDALAATGVRAWVVAAPYQLPIRGLHYGPDFYRALDGEKRVMAVNTVPPYPLLRWQLDPQTLVAIHHRVDAMSKAALTRSIKRVQPTLVKVGLPTRLSPQGRILVPVPVSRFK